MKCKATVSVLEDDGIVTGCYVTLGDDGVKASKTLRLPNINVDVDEDGRIIGIETIVVDLQRKASPCTADAQS